MTLVTLTNDDVDNNLDDIVTMSLSRNVCLVVRISQPVPVGGCGQQTDVTVVSRNISLWARITYVING